MKIALIGTGFIAQMHRDTLLMLGEEIALVVGHSKEKARTFAETCRKPGVWAETAEPGTGDGEIPAADHLTAEMLAEIDCAVICTPPSRHAQAVRACIAGHTHILCEKPLALDPAEAETLAAEAEASGLVCAVNFNNRFYDGLQEIRDSFAKEERLFISARYFQEFQMMPAVCSWRFTDPMRTVTEIGSHLVDLIGYLTGRRVCQVSAEFFNSQPRRRLDNGMLDHCPGEEANITVDNEDGVYAVLRFTDGSRAGLTLCEVAPGRSNDLSVEIIGKEKSLSWSAQRPYETVIGEKGCRMTTVTNAFGKGFSGTMEESVRVFLDTVRTGKWDRRLTSFREAAECAAVCGAMKQSSREDGRFVKIGSRSGARRRLPLSEGLPRR